MVSLMSLFHIAVDVESRLLGSNLHYSITNLSFQHQRDSSLKFNFSWLSILKCANGVIYGKCFLQACFASVCTCWVELTLPFANDAYTKRYKLYRTVNKNDLVSDFYGYCGINRASSFLLEGLKQRDASVLHYFLRMKRLPHTQVCAVGLIINGLRL